MKKILSLILLVTLFASCSSDDNEPTQDYTSFVFYHNEEGLILPNCVVAYKNDNKYYKIAELGDLSKGKYSSEISIENNNISEIFIFSDSAPTARLDKIFKLNKFKKNVFEIESGTKGILVSDKADPYQYPQ